VFAPFFERHDLPSQLQPRVDGERLKPDVEVVINGSTFFLDVCLVSPVEPTLFPRWVEAAMSLSRCATGSPALGSLKGSKVGSNALRSVLMKPDAFSP